eukprot:113074_1
MIKHNQAIILFVGIVASSKPIFANASLRGHVSSTETPCQCGNGKAKIWGPGGPHTALIPAADLFNVRQKANGDSEGAIPIEICFGPESTWREQALECAGGLMTAAEQQVAGFARVYEGIL